MKNAIDIWARPHPNNTVSSTMKFESENTYRSNTVIPKNKKIKAVIM
jgi:hypothetical protein